MGSRSVVFVGVLAVAAGACAETSEPRQRDSLRLDVGPWGGVEVVGFAEAPPIETDQLPVYELLDLGIAAVDAVVDAETGTLVWIDARGRLWMDAGDGARGIGEQVIPGLAAARGKLAFAVRLDGPETAPFAIDLRTLEVTALDDAPGPDEVLAWSPDGREVLLLSGRTGLASLFAAGADGAASADGGAGARQLTNVGLAPGRGLDVRRVAPAPVRARDVAWGARGIAYRAGEGGVFVLEPGRELRRVDVGDRVAIEEVVR